MNSPQASIFALGTSSHAYLEFDVVDQSSGAKLVDATSALREPRTTIGGVNLVVGFRPELWSRVAPDHAPADVHGFNSGLAGADGFVMPATQHDAVLWLSGSAYDVLFDVAQQAIGAVKELASVAEETSSWAYRHDRDLTGFIDGSENPSLIDASDAAVISEGKPGEGGSILLLQKWKHDTTAWESLPVDQQERIMGRRKTDGVELDDKASDSHVASTDQDQFGKIFRRNMPYGTVSDHGTMFAGFSADQQRLSAMLESMAGLRTGTRRAHAVHAADHRRLLFRTFDRQAGPTPLVWDRLNSYFEDAAFGRGQVLRALGQIQTGDRHARCGPGTSSRTSPAIRRCSSRRCANIARRSCRVRSTPWRKYGTGWSRRP